MTILSVLATIIGTMMGLANIPQAIKIFKRKSAKDISIVTCFILFFGSIIWATYGIELRNFAIIISNAIGVFVISSVIIGWFLYGKEKNKKINKK